MDTDSIVFLIRLKKLKYGTTHFRKGVDVSDLQGDHKPFSTENQKILGKMKLESSPDNELDLLLYSRCKSCDNEKPSSGKESKQNSTTT